MHRWLKQWVGTHKGSSVNTHIEGFGKVPSVNVQSEVMNIMFYPSEEAPQRIVVLMANVPKNKVPKHGVVVDKVDVESMRDGRVRCTTFIQHNSQPHTIEKYDEDQ